MEYLRSCKSSGLSGLTYKSRSHTSCRCPVKCQFIGNVLAVVLRTVLLQTLCHESLPSRPPATFRGLERPPRQLKSSLPLAQKTACGHNKIVDKARRPVQLRGRGGGGASSQCAPPAAALPTVPSAPLKRQFPEEDTRRVGRYAGLLPSFPSIRALSHHGYRRHYCQGVPASGTLMSKTGHHPPVVCPPATVGEVPTTVRQQPPYGLRAVDRQLPSSN